MINIKNICWLIMLGCIVLSIPAFALNPRPYFRAEIGAGGMDTKYYSANNTPYNDVSLRSSAAVRLSTGVLLAYAKFNYGLETGYASYPNNRYRYNFPTLGVKGSQTYNGYTVDLLGVLEYHLPVFTGVSVLGKLGVAAITQTFDGNATGLGTSFVTNKTTAAFKPEIALGANYYPGTNQVLSVTYYHTFAYHPDPASLNSMTDLASINLIMAGISFLFD